MRILYAATDEAPEFRFIVVPDRRGRAVGAAPDAELRGVASFRGGTLILRELTFAKEAGITTANLRTLPLRAVRDSIYRDRRDAPAFFEQVAAGAVKEEAEPPRAKRSATTSPAARRAARAVAAVRERLPLRRGRTADEFYRLVAEAYLALLDLEPRNPVHALAEALRTGAPDLAEATVAGWVRRAREHDWLSEASHGRAGAEPGLRLLTHRLSTEQPRKGDE